jgi:hypothetical protein
MRGIPQESKSLVYWVVLHKFLMLHNALNGPWFTVPQHPAHSAFPAAHCRRARARRAISALLTCERLNRVSFAAFACSVSHLRANHIMAFFSRVSVEGSSGGLQHRQARAHLAASVGVIGAREAQAGHRRFVVEPARFAGSARSAGIRVRVTCARRASHARCIAVTSRRTKAASRALQQMQNIMIFCHATPSMLWTRYHRCRQ